LQGPKRICIEELNTEDVEEGECSDSTLSYDEASSVSDSTGRPHTTLINSLT